MPLFTCHQRPFSKPHLWLITLVGLIVPRRLRADWRQEWEAELQYRAEMLAEWDRLTWQNKLDLLRRSTSAFWDALVLQPKRWEDEMIQDLRFAVRMLLKHKGFTAVAVLSLGLGIGANTIVFSLVNALFFSAPSGVAAAEQLVGACALNTAQHRLAPQNIRYPDYLHYRDHNTVFSGLAGYFSAHLADGDFAAEVQAQVISESYFTVLGVRPLLGRYFLPEENRIPGRNPVAVLSYAFWQRRFNGDARCIGQTLKLNGVTFTVVGIAPQDFHGVWVGNTYDVWIPTMMAQAAYRDVNILSRDSAELELVGRLKSTATREQAQAEMTTLARQLEASYPATNKDAGVQLYELKGLHPIFRDEQAELPRVLAVTVLCLLLIACANLAGLLLARGATRQKEIAIRLALGSSRARLMRQLLTESVLLSLLGGLVGWALAAAASGLVGDFYFSEVEGVKPFHELHFDGQVFLFSFLLAGLTGMLFGLIPALQASRPALVPALKDDASAFGYRRSRLRAAFLVVQVALSVVLLVAAGLMLQSLRNLKWDAGFDARNVVFIRMKPHLSGYDQQQAQVYFQNVQRRVASLAGVQSVAFAGYPPLRNWGGDASVVLPGEQFANEKDKRQVKQNKVAPGFFETLRIPLLQGRDFTNQDRQEGRRAVIINETLARQLWPKQDAVGQSVLVEDQPCEVVGVARYNNFRQSGEPAEAYIFRADFGGNRMLVRLQGDPRGMLPRLRQEILAVDPNVAISEALPLTEMVQNFRLMCNQFASLLSGTFVE
ncbi:MAG: ABC transporter permease [Acidobacteria bacterium]|nr:ABC transporter permease [Acidobacteriota bacterium]MBI3425400.1 ABC transporter permease [Acidobacteriota bacterium]